MFEVVAGILIECGEILVESAPYVLFGFFSAGVLKALLLLLARSYWPRVKMAGSGCAATDPGRT